MTATPREGKARRLLTDGRIMLGFAGPNTDAAGSARQSDQAAPPQAVHTVPPDKVEEWFIVFIKTFAAFVAFFWSGIWLLDCFRLPPPGGGVPGQLVFNIGALGFCSLLVVCSAVCLVAFAAKICLKVIRASGLIFIRAYGTLRPDQHLLPKTPP